MTTIGELRFLARAARNVSDPSLQKLLREDLLYRAASTFPDGIEYLIRGALIGVNEVTVDERMWSDVDRILARAHRRSTDILFIAVKRPEMEAARLVFGVSENRPSHKGARGSRFWDFNIPREAGQNALRAALTVVGEAQNYKMSSFMHTVLGEYEPKVCVLIGMAAGRNGRGGVNLGDVVVATEVVDYACARLTVDEVIAEPTFYTCDHEFTRPFASLGAYTEEWHSALAALIKKIQHPARVIESPLPKQIKDNAESYAPRLKPGVILAGDYLIEDASLSVHAVEVKRKRTLAAEMEGAGFAYFCEEAGVKWMVIRGIADFGGKRRVKDWQFVSTMAAAQIAKILFERGEIRVL